MYEKFYDLKVKPFSIVPDPGMVFWGKTHTNAAAMIRYGLVESGGITVLTGDSGCGKTTLIRRLLEHYGRQVSIGVLSNLPKYDEDLIGWILYAFGQTKFDLPTRVGRFHALQQFIIDEYQAGRQAILIIDEAQNLKSEQIDELRMLTNINSGQQLVFQLVLVGSSKLRDLLNEPDLKGFSERVVSDHHLGPLTEEEVSPYIGARLEAAGREEALFGEDAIILIGNFSKRVPRDINRVCDLCLVYGFVNKLDFIHAFSVEKVIREVDRQMAENRSGGSRKAPESISSPLLDSSDRLRVIDRKP